METIKRSLQDKITNRLEAIFGARRVGKTVLVREIIKTFPGKTLLLNGEDNASLALLADCSISNYRHLLENIDLLAIDEAQNVEFHCDF